LDKDTTALWLRNKPLELFRHAAPELQDTLNAHGILRIPFSVEQEAALYPVRDSDELAD
jgi:hypothetical protein